MYIKTVFTLLFLVLSNVIFSQSGTVIYNNSLTPPEGLEELKKNNPEKFKKISFMIDKMKRDTNRKIYTLKFNEEQSKFFTNPSMAKEDNAMAGMPMTESDYYYDLTSNERYENNNIGGKELLVDKEPIDWTISNKTKMIKGYNCRKAEATQSFYSIDRQSGKLKTKEQPITAWFTTELPFSFGPENYGGLPGLVLELSTQGKNYKVEKLDIKENKNITIDFPDLEKAISEQEAAKKINKAMSNMIGG